MSKLSQTANKVVDSTVNVIDKVSSPSSRAGSTVERVGKMLEAKVPPKVIACLMTENSSNKHIYSESDINAIGQLYEDAKTKVVVRSKETRALIKEQQNHNLQILEPSIS